MASEKISAMPSLGGNQVPSDLVPLVDLSAIPANQNVRSSLNDLFATVTKNITDRAVRFDAPGSTPALSAAGAGALYFDGTKFQVSENTAAWAALVVAGLISGSGLTQNTARLLGRTTAGVGAVEEISVGANLAFSAGSLAVTGVALSGLVTASGLTQNTARLLGRTTAGVGAVEEISIGPGLTLTGGVLDATGGGGGTPGGSQYDVQFHDSGGTFGGSNNFQFKPSGNPTVSIRATSASHNVLDLTANVAQTAEVLLIKQDGDNTASLLTLRQGPLSALNSSFPFRFENASGTLILGLRSRPAIGSYQFVSPGANNGQVVYETNAVGSNNGLGTASVSGYPAIFAGNMECLWFSAGSGNTVVNQNYQLTWGSAPNSWDVGISRATSYTLQITNGSTQGGRLQVGGATGTSAALAVNNLVGGSDVTCILTNRNTTAFTAGTVFATETYLTATPSSAATSTYYVAGSNQVQTLGSANVAVLYGLQNIAWHSSTGSANLVVGLKCLAYSDTGTVSELIGGDFVASLLAAGTATRGYGVKISVSRGTGTIVNGYGVYISSIVATNAYGVFVNSGYPNVANGGSANWATVSDQRFKRDIVNYERGLETVLQLRPRRFIWNELSTCPGKNAVGLIAQEAQAVDYELVSEINADSPTGSMLTVDVANITHMLINSTKTLHQRITALEEKIHA